MRAVLSRYLESVVLGENCGVISWLIRALMWPLSLAYRAGLWVYLASYRLGIRKRCRLGVPVISVGNLTFGGTGKTPAVQTICRMLIDQGKSVVVLSRGHGGKARDVTVVSDGERILADSTEAGDEPIMLARTLSGVPVVVGRDRRASGRLACERFSPDVIVLDDGMQYWQLDRDLEIAVLDAKRPFGSGYLMPMGDLREPASGLRRADIVLLANAREIGDVGFRSLLDRIEKLSGCSIFRCAHEPICFINAETGESVGLEWVRGRRVMAFCGIGRPTAFLDMLDGLAAVVLCHILFPDHYRLSGADVKRIIDEAEACRAEAIITTEKDIARLGTPPVIPKLYALAIRFEIEDSAGLAQHIANRIDAQNTPAPAS